jgi:hypothetical protein
MSVAPGATTGALCVSAAQVVMAIPSSITPIETGTSTRFTPDNYLYLQALEL